jgi:hypothetical protein
MRLVILTLLFASAFAQDGYPTNGNLIPEPNLADYAQATRSPGIMGQATDIVDQNGNSIQ